MLYIDWRRCWARYSSRVIVLLEGADPPTLQVTHSNAPGFGRGRCHVAPKNDSPGDRGTLPCDLDDLIGLKQCRCCFTIALFAELLMWIIQRHVDIRPELADHGSALARF